MKKCIAPVLIILLFTYSVMPAFSTETDISAKAVADARKDAAADINQTRWLFYGCCFGITGYFGIIGYIAALRAEAEIPTQRLIGKSPEYVIHYSVEYRRKVKSLRTNYVLKGCIAGTVISGCPAIVILSSWEQQIMGALFGDIRFGGF